MKEKKIDDRHRELLGFIPRYPRAISKKELAERMQVPYSTIVTMIFTLPYDVPIAECDDGSLTMPWEYAI